VWLWPHRYIQCSHEWLAFDLFEWSQTEYEYRRDPPGFWNDRAQRPEETVERNDGDCEDYALVAASWACSHGRDVGLAVTGHSRYGVPVPTHMVAFDDTYVYSSGVIRDQSVPEFVATSEEYDWSLTKRLSKTGI
jgi:hypothetical protein